MVKELFDKLIAEIKSDNGKITSLSILAKYICPIIAFWCFILILSLTYEKSYDYSDLKKVEGNLKQYKEQRVTSILDIIGRGKGWKSYQLNIYLENSPTNYTMFDNIHWYSFLYGLKEGDKLDIYYLPQYDNRIKELIVNGSKKYSFEQENIVLTGRIKDNFNFIMIALIVHFLWRYNYPKFLWQKDDSE